MKNTLIFFLVLSMIACKKDEPREQEKPKCYCGEVFQRETLPSVWRIHVKNNCSGDTLIWNVGETLYPNYPVGSTFCDEGQNEW